MVYRRAKIFALLLIFLFLNYLTQDFNLINIEKTAIIVTIGVDKSQQGYTVTAQIAVPEGPNKQSTNDESVISADGKTIYEAISIIGEQTGWYPRLSFCNLIVIGENVLEDNVMDVIDFFIKSYKVEDSSVLCAYQGKAKDLLLSSSPLDNISGLSLSKIFVRDSNGASRVLTTSIKDFTIGYYSKSHASYMPLVKTIPTSESGTGGKTAEASTSIEPNSGSGSSSSSGGNEQKLVVYDANSTVLFNKGYKVGELTGDESLSYSLLYKGVKEAHLNIVATDNDGNTGNVSVNILRSSNKVELIYEDDTPILYCYLKVWARIIDTNFSESIETIKELGKLNENMIFKVEEKIKSNIESVFNKSKSSECDIFKTKTNLYRYHFAKYDKDNLVVLKNVLLKTDITCLNYI